MKEKKRRICLSVSPRGRGGGLAGVSECGQPFNFGEKEQHFPTAVYVLLHSVGVQQNKQDF